MKKIIILVTAVAMTAVARAATVSWTISNVQTSEAVLLTSGSVYVFFATSAGNATTEINAIKALAGTGASALGTAMASAEWNDIKRATAAGNFSMGSSAALGSYTLPNQTTLGLAGNTPYTAYAVIFDTATITDDSQFLVTTSVTATTFDNSSSLNKAFTIGSQSSNTSWNAVGSSVPEPTSGLLLLLGMAGLALKRKNA